MIHMPSNNDIDALCDLVSEVRVEAKDNNEFGFNDEFPTFLKKMYLLNPQSYGPRIQNRIRKELKWDKIKPSADNGDILSPKDQSPYEVKASLITESNQQLNLVQIRLWQNVSYICFWFNVKTGEFSTYILTHEQMEDEVGIMGSSAHGTKSSIQENKNKELRLSLNIDKLDLNFVRWESLYKSDLLDFLFKVKK